VAAGEEPLGVDEEPFLVVDLDNGVARWGQTELAINANADLAVLSVLSSQKDRLVPYTDLLRAIKPNALSNEVKSLKEAPPEVKFAVAHIRKAFKDAGCPYKIRAIRNKGYRLLSFNE
jgi:DNA-binding response OmpR family regulator